MAEFIGLVGLSGWVLLYLLAQTGSDARHESLAPKITAGRWLFSLTTAVLNPQSIGPCIAVYSRHRLSVVSATTEQSLPARPINWHSGGGFRKEFELATASQ